MVMSGENTDPRVEPGIGRSLERARESRGLSLRQVEQETRIRSRYLHDLERENFDVLPAVYVLGSLKTYADFLGLDGAALSRQLKASLVEPAEADAPAQPAALGDARDEDDEYEAAPVPAVGFDQLFLGMGVILISILAVMTIVTAVAQGDESPISQIDQPSTPEAPSEIALAGNVREEDGANEDGKGGPANDENNEVQPETPKDDGDGEEDDKDDGEASQSASLFGDAEFVPVSPSSPTADASASASPASSSPAPTTAEPEDAQASSAPKRTPPASTAPSSNEASPGSSGDAPGAASPAPSGGASPKAGGGGGGAPAGGSGSDPMSTEAGRVAGEALEKAGIVR
jgi:cytoskeletal protein RodZ